MHHHLTDPERAALAALVRLGLSYRKAAEELGIHNSAVSREFRRNVNEDGAYHASSAAKKARARRADSRTRSRRIENDPILASSIETLLRDTLSPEQIAHALGSVSRKAIYSWINRSRPDLKKHLRRKGKKRRRYGTKHLLNRYQAAKRPLSERPAIASRRSRIGDWEGDTAKGKNRISVLLVYADRKSRYILAAYLPRGTAEAVRLATKRLFRNKPVRTITFDNGSEFSLHRSIEKDLNAKVYFARPGHPEERGTGENSIGLLREFFPKGTDLNAASRLALLRALHLINHRPRKVLGWKTACAVFGECCV